MSFERTKSFFRKFTQEPGSDYINYINTQITGARTAQSDNDMRIVAIKSNKTIEQLAREQAEIGWPANTASLLSAVTLPIGDKGRLLAQAYEGLADKAQYWADHERLIVLKEDTKEMQKYLEKKRKDSLKRLKDYRNLNRPLLFLF